MSYGKSVDAEWHEGMNSDARDTVRITMLRQSEIDLLCSRIKGLVADLGNDSPLLGKVKMLYGWLTSKFDKTTFSVLSLEVERLEKLITASRSR